MDSTSKEFHDVYGISEFYAEKSVFLTGASGYVGTVILETLLRCCPGIKNVYILLREKKGVEPNERLKNILQKKIFKNLECIDPEAIQKIRVVEGDVTQEELGISPGMMLEMRDDVAVVFHCAAVISFAKSLGEMIISNVIGTDNVLEFSRGLPKLEAFVHCSTAYSNCNIKHIKEKIYRLRVPPKAFMDAARKSDDHKLNVLSSLCVPPWPNTYTFSKAMAEEVVANGAEYFKVAVVRPSIVICSWQGALPGYVEAGAGIVDLSLAVGKGFINVVNVRESSVVNLIPVDVVANTMITSAWYIGTRNVQDPLVVNCTTSGDQKIMWGTLFELLMNLNLRNPLPKTYQNPSLFLRNNKLTYWTSIGVNHYVPGLCIDAVLIALGKKPILTKKYRFYDKVASLLRPFLHEEWDFDCTNLKMLASAQDAKDRKVFPMNVEDMKLEELVESLPTGSPFYDWNIDQRSFDERISVAQKRYLLTTFLKWTAIFWFFSFFGLLLWLCVRTY